MAEHLKLGKKGEEQALEFLKKQGFKILAQNWRVHHLEIDIIAEKKKVIHFVEVKTRKAHGMLSARESLSPQKRKNLEKLVALWLQQNPTINKKVQLDFIAITADEMGGYSIEYYPNYTQN